MVSSSPMSSVCFDLYWSVVAKSGHPASKEQTLVFVGLEMSQKIGKGYGPSVMFEETNQKTLKTNKQQKEPHT